MASPEELNDELFRQIRKNNLEGVRNLLQMGANVNGRNRYKETPLRMAVFQGCLQIVCELLKHEKLDVNARDSDGDTALILACSHHRHPDIALEILKHAQVDVNAVGCSGYTALMKASVYLDRHLGIVRELLMRENLDVNAKTGHYSSCRTAFMMACKYRRLGVVKELLKDGRADVNAKDRFGCTALMLTCSSDESEDILVELLKVDGVDVNAKDSTGKTPLMLAICHRYSTSVRVLLEDSRVDVNVEDDTCRTALMLAIIHDDVLVRELLKHDRMDVNAKICTGKTALILAICHGHLKTARVLLENGSVDVNA